MKASWEFTGVLVTMAVLFAVQIGPVASADRPTRFMAAAIVIVVAGFTMAIVRSRKRNV